MTGRFAAVSISGMTALRIRFALTMRTMVVEVPDLPAGVVGFVVSGTVVAEDFRHVIIPAIERAAATGEVRFLVEIPTFDGMTPSALWDDLNIGIHHLRAWKRIALVTDIEWMHTLTAMFGWMTPGQIKVFPLSQRGEAISWVTA